MDSIRSGTRGTRVRVKVLKVKSVVKRPRMQPYVVSAKPKTFNLQRQSKQLLRHLYKAGRQAFKGAKHSWAWAYRQPRVPVMAALLALFVAFGGGMWAVLSTSKSSADDTLPTSATNYYIPISGQGGLGPTTSEPDKALFNMTMSQLENYFKDVANSNRQVAYEALLADRKAKLKAYLQEKNSPLVDIVDTIAELKHWNIVLAISNSESSLGKHCYNNNCSGIGIAPDQPQWRDYSSKREWAIDLDKLIEKRYKDWTLEQMNGVYNKPGSENWVMASTQILEELQARGIE